MSAAKRDYRRDIFPLLAPMLAALAAMSWIWNAADTHPAGVWNQALIMLAIGSAIAIWQVVRYAKPLRELTKAIGQVADGDGVADEFLAAGGPLSQLATDVSRMSAAVAQREKRLQATIERMSTVFGAMQEGVLAVNEQQRVLFANRATGEMLGFDAEQASSKLLSEVAHNRLLREAVAAALATSSGPEKELPTYEFTSVQNPGQTMAFRATRLPGEPCPGVVLVLQDVSELRRLETLRQEFVANVSHELKTPLTAIKAYAETLLDGAIDDATINREFLQQIDSESDRLYELILDMLRLAQIESGHGRFEMATVSVLQTVADCIRRNQTAATRKNITLTHETGNPDLATRADREGLVEVLDNLVDNAIKYTQPGGNVSVAWRGDDGHVVIKVCDDGIGIAADEQSRVFERFYRVDKARSRELGSTGLGLSIVKHLIQTFGGSVALDSQPGKGSTFTVRLPAALVETPV